jgi:hypothetical protein
MKLNYWETAGLLGLVPGDLDALISGHVYADVAKRLGVNISDAQGFIAGEVSYVMVQRLGFKTPAAAEELARALAKEGRIGLLIGILISG